MIGFKLERIDVLILLGWILGILHGAIGAPPKPFGVLRHIRMVGGTLEGNIQRNVDTVFTRLREEAPKVLQRAELWMNRLVSPLRRANPPGAARIIRAGKVALFRPLRCVAPMGWMGGR